MSNKRLEYNIGFNVNNTSLDEVFNQLQKIKNLSENTYFKLKGADASTTELLKIKDTAGDVQRALQNSFNPKLNTVNFQKFNEQLSSSGKELKTIQAEFNKLGTQGSQAFKQLTDVLITSNAEITKSKSLLSSITDTLLNAAKWSFAYGAINKVTNGIKSAWQYAVSLDSALNDIRIVTNKSYEDMEKFSASANKAAKALGTSTLDYTKGSLIYYQQGLSDREVAARTAVTAKAANVTGQSMTEVSEQLTAVWNGFQVAASNTEEYVDKLAAVAAASASDLEELSTAMSRVASSANTMGVDIDQLTAQIATIESVTRQDAASIGTSLKTIYARMGDLAIGAEDEFGVALGDVSGKMKQMGIDILDQQGNMRDMGVVIEEVAAKWSTWTEAQQQAAAVALAGKRQYNNLFALFENWDTYESNKKISENSLGTLQKQQDTYMESTAAHLEQLGTAAEKIKDALFDNKGFNDIIDFLTSALDLIGDLVESIGGIGPIITVIATVFASQIGDKVGAGILKMRDSLVQLKNIFTLQATGQEQIQNAAQNWALEQLKNLDKQSEAYKKIISLKQEELKYEKYMTEEQRARFNESLKQMSAQEERKTELGNKLEDIKDISGAYGLGRGLGKKGRLDTQQFDPKIVRVKLDEQGNPIHYNRSTEDDNRTIYEQIENKTGRINKYGKINEEGNFEYIGKNEVTKALDTFNSNIEAIEKLNEKRATDLSVTSYAFKAFKNTNKKEEDLYEINSRRAAAATDTLVSQAEEILSSDGGATQERKQEIQNALDKFYQQVTDTLLGEKLLNDVSRMEDSGETGTAAYAAKKRILSGAGNYKKDINSVTSQLEQAKQTNNIQEAEKAEKILNRLTECQVAYENELKNVYNYQDLDSEQKKEFISSSKAAMSAVEGLSEALNNNVKATRKDMDAAKEASSAQKEFNNITEEAIEKDKAIKNGLKDQAFQEKADEITKLVGTITDAVGVYQAVSSIMTTFSDDSLDTGEKVKKVFLGIIGVIAMMTPAIIQSFTLLRTQSTAALGWIGIILEAVALLVGVIAGLASSIKSADEQAKEFLEDANSALEDTKQRLEDTKTAYSNLLDTITNYKDALNSIEELKAGTEEWKDAIYDANAQALELLNIYPELAAYVQTLNNGVIQISNEGFEVLKENQKKQIYKQSAAVYASQATVSEAESAYGRAQAGEALGSALEKTFDKIFESSNAFASSTARLERAKQRASSDLVDKYYNDSYFSLDKTSFIKYLKEEGLVPKNLKGKNISDEAVKELDEILRDTVETIRENKEATDRLREAYVKNSLESTGNKDYKNAKNKDAVAAAVSAAMGNVEDKYTKDNFRKDETAFKKDLADSLGISSDKITDVTDSEIKYYDSQGNPQSMSIVDALTQINMDNARKQVEKDDLKDIVKVTNKIESSKFSSINELAGGKTDSTSLSGATKNDLNNMSDWAQKNITDEEAKTMGFESKEEFMNSLNGSIKLSQSEYNAALDKIGRSGLESFDKNKDYTVSQIKEISTAIRNAYNTAGKEGAAALGNLIQSVGEEQGTKIAEISSQIDWSNEDAADQFNAKLEEVGINIDSNSEAYKAFVAQLKLGNNVLYRSATELDDILDKVKELRDLLGDIKSGDIISDENYKKIIALYSGAKEFFIRTATGWQFIGNSIDQINSGFNERYSSLEDAKDTYERLSALGENFSDKSFNAEATGTELFSNIRDIIGNWSAESGLPLISNDIIAQTGKSYSQKDIEKAFAAFSKGTQTDEQEQMFQDIVAAAMQIQQNQANGKYTADNAITSYFSSDNLINFKSYGEVLQNKSYASLTEEQKKKIKDSWSAVYAAQFNISKDTFDELAATSGGVMAAYEKLNQLENYANKIEGIEKATDSLTGAEKRAALDQINKIYEQANKNYNDLIEAEKKALGIESSGSDYVSLLEEFEQKKSNLTDNEIQQWETLLEHAKEASEAITFATEAIISGIDSILQEGLNASERIKKTQEIIIKANRKNGFAFADDQTIGERYSLNTLEKEQYTQNYRDYQTAISELKEKIAQEENENEKQRYQAQLDEYESAFQDLIESQIENIKDLYSIWEDGWNQITESCDNYAKALESLNSIYDKQLSLQKIINEKYFNQDILNAQADNIKTMIEVYRTSYSEALERYNKALTSGSQAEIDSAKSAMTAAADSYLSTVEEYYEKLKSNLNETIESIYTQLGIATDSERWERAGVKADTYLDAVNSQYNINKIKRQYQSAIDSANSLNAKTQLRIKMEEELVKLQEKKDKLSQYEVDRANAVYELTLKQIALEESQRNASKMKLVRDSNGKLTYAFVQDQDTISKAKEEFEEAQNNLFNIDNDELRSQIDKYYQYQAEAQQKLSEATTKEQYDELIEYYYGTDGILTKLQDSLPSIQKNLMSSFKDILPEGDIDSLFTYAESTKITAVSMKDTSEKLLAAYESFNEKVEELKESDLAKALTDIADSESGLIKTLKDTLDDSYKKNIESIKTSLETIAEELSSSNIKTEDDSVTEKKTMPATENSSIVGVSSDTTRKPLIDENTGSEDFLGTTISGTNVINALKNNSIMPPPDQIDRKLTGDVVNSNNQNINNTFNLTYQGSGASEQDFKEMTDMFTRQVIGVMGETKR